MKVLSVDELQGAEERLRRLIPESLKVYGFLCGMNRNIPSALEVVVDTWPDFKVIICRPKNKRAPDYMRRVTIYSTDEQTLQRMLTEEEDAIDWSGYFLLGGCDIRHTPMLKLVASARGVDIRRFTLVHLMYLPDCSLLPSSEVNSETKLRISPLNTSNIDLVNKTWKFGGDENGYRYIESLISNFPSCCITDGQGQPVSWILMYNYCAMGFLYTLPEHRGKGYAKALVCSIAKKLQTLGYPVYCFIEEENTVSYRLFKKLGFIEDPSYRAAWFEFNF